MKFSERIKLFLPLFFLSLCSGCKSIEIAHNRFPLEKGNYIYFLGEGEAPPDNINITQRRSSAQRAAELNGSLQAAHYFLTLIKDQKTSPSLATDILSRYVIPVKSEWDQRDNCRTLMRINKKTALKTLFAD